MTPRLGSHPKKRGVAQLQGKMNSRVTRAALHHRGTLIITLLAVRNVQGT